MIRNPSSSGSPPRAAAPRRDLRSRVRSVIPLLLCSLACLPACRAPTSPPGGPTREPAASHAPRTVAVRLGDCDFTLEVADTPLALHNGLGNRPALAPGAGMLFIFPAPDVQSFVMRDCPVALDLIYLDSESRITSITTMPPEPPRSHRERAHIHSQDAAYNARLRGYLSPGPALYAIELPSAATSACGVQIGDRIDVPQNPQRDR